MVNINVKTLIRYRATPGMDKNSNEWRAIHIKKIIKDEDLNPKSHFNWICQDGINRQISALNKALFLKDLLQAVTKKIIQDHGDDIIIVPVPNSEAIIGYHGEYRTLALARMIAKHSNGRIEVLDALRWKENKGAAHKNQKARHCDSHIANLKVIAKSRREVILFDDVVTTGSQLVASKIKLEAEAFKIVDYYAVFDVLEADVRGTAPKWMVHKKSVQTFNDFF